MHNNVTAKDYFERLTKVIAELNMDEFESAIALITEAWQNGRQIITMGNGGSLLTALHFIHDWNKGVFLSTGKPFYGRSLCDNIGLLTAYANDISYQDIFSEQLKNILHPGDLVIAISGSGNSENICRAVEYANQHGAVTLGLCGYSGGRLKELAQHAVWVNVHDMQLCEDIHAIFGHILMQKLCGLKSC